MSRTKGSTIRLLALFLAVVMTLFSLPLIVMTSNAASGSEIAAQHRLGSWWWWPTDGFNDAEATKYLTLYQQSGINEIYFYAYTYLGTPENRAKIHTFVQKAMSYGCRVSIMYDGWADLKKGDTSYLTTNIKEGFLAYKKEYPKDAVYGLHFDMEPTGGRVDQTFVDYFIAPLQELRAADIWCEVDVSVNWQRNGGNGVTYDGVTGINDILAKYTDTMSLMSYRTKADKVISCGSDCLKSAIKYGCPITYGLETGDSGEGSSIDFKGSTKEKLFAVLDEVFELLDAKNLTIPYGMAIHQNRAFYELAGEVPSRTTHGSLDENASTTKYSRVTEDPTATTTQVTYELQKTELYKKTGMSDNYYTVTSNGIAIKIPELSEALVADFEQNGPIDPNQGEYYELTVMGVSILPDYYYPCLSDSRCRDIWPEKEDYPSGNIISNIVVGFPPTITANLRKTVDFTRNGSEDDENAHSNTFFIACDRGENYLDIRGLIINVYRNPYKVTTTATEPAPTTTETEAQPTVTETEVQPTAAVLLGDANSDGAVNMKDVLTMRKFLANIPVEMDMTAADVTQDGAVNMKDVLVIRKFLAGLGGIGEAG